ncbi:winged helix-turn-helix domain-containing protein [Marichromatium sp. AB32]|uniref:winged helix-turn-helix domain-containing protein n=1 Tax=Marichromatium sp. AB32 TaxID=2483363 RepID=UPI000F3D4B3D|nr:winged helix-turn-helix domain-containing protein [Marichromatium sp. AB32]RNE92572.1 ArsR family transcriptional regulator [Marichromatium sp. AB32]
MPVDPSPSVPVDPVDQVRRAIIECLNRFYAIESGMWGDPLSSLMIRTVIQARLEGRPHDISSLSTCLDLSLATVHRKLKRIAADGYIEMRREGRSIRLYPTERVEVLFDTRFDEMIETLRALYGRGEGRASDWGPPRPSCVDDGDD